MCKRHDVKWSRYAFQLPSVPRHSEMGYYTILNQLSSTFCSETEPHIFMKEDKALASKDILTRKQANNRKTTKRSCSVHAHL